MIPPWNPTSSTLNPKICKVVTSTVPWAAAYASAKLFESMIHPITIPMIGLPPNLFTVLYATHNGRNPKIAPDEMLIRRTIPYNVSLLSTAGRLPSTLDKPVSKAAARIPGMISINTSDKAFNAFCRGFIFCPAFVFKSPRLIVFIWFNSPMTSHTSLTRPVPKIICTWSPATNTPFTRSTSSIAFMSAFSLSASTNRNLVAQCASPTIFSRPPANCVIFSEIA